MSCSNCNGIEIPIGPQGPQGPQGEPGADGTSGDIFLTSSTDTINLFSYSEGDPITLTVGLDLAYIPEQIVLVFNDTSNLFYGKVVSYDPVTGQLDLEVISVTGVGNLSSWQVTLGVHGQYLLDRSNHTGTQDQSTITDLVTDLAAKGDMFKSIYDTDNDNVVDNSERLSGQLPAYYLNRNNHTGTQSQSTIVDLATDLAAKEDTANKGATNGYAPLVGGTIPLAYLTTSPNAYQGLYNATTNTPAILNGVGTAGDFYIANVTGNAYAPVNVTIVNQIVAYNGATWEVGAVFTGGISDVNGYTGPTVTLDLDDIADTATRFAADANEKDAMLNANSPNAGNPFATISDLVAIGITYAVTPDEFANGETIGNNTTTTLTSLGYTNVSAALIWPLVAANAAWVGAIDVTTMTIDWIAIQEAFLTMETGQRSYFISPNGSRRYRVNHSIKLPRYNGAGAGTALNIDFMGAKVANVSGTNLIVLDRFAPDQATALGVWASNPLHISNLTIEGNGVNTNTSNIGIRVAANIKGSYTNIISESAACNMALYFNLCVTLTNCQFTGCGLYSIATSDASASSNTLGASWSGASNSNSQCNHIQYNNVRCQPGGDITMISAFYHKGGYGHVLQNCNVENMGGTIQSLVLYDSAGDPVENCLKITGLNFEITGDVDTACVRAYSPRGLFVFDYIHGYVSGTCRAFVEGHNKGGSQHPTIILRDCEGPAVAPLSSVVTAANLTNGRGYQYNWVIENVTPTTQEDIFDASNWVSTGPAVWDGVTENAVIPDRTHVRYRPLFTDLNDFYINSVDQEIPDVNDFPQVASIYGTTNPTAAGLTPTYIGQIYVKTSSPQTVYVAFGTSSPANWLAL